MCRKDALLIEFGFWGAFQPVCWCFFQGVPGNPGEPGLKGDKVI